MTNHAPRLKFISVGLWCWYHKTILPTLLGFEERRSPEVFQAMRRSLSRMVLLKYEVSYFVNRGMGRIRLRVREFAEEKGWTLKEVSNRTGVPYTTIATYAKSTGMATVDYTALHKMARVFDVSVEDLVEILEE